MDETNAYDDGLLYRKLHDGRVHDIAHYLAAAEELRADASVLDYGVGSGRVALPIARMGRRVVGVDISEAMLGALKASLNAEQGLSELITVVCGNARDVQLEERFELVICPFNGIAHHHSAAELGAFLSRVKQHLAPGGHFVFDVLVPDPSLLLGSISEVPWARHPGDGSVCRVHETTRYDPQTQVMTIETSLRFMQDDRPAEVTRLCLRQLFPQETLLLLELHGFRVIEVCDLGDVLAYTTKRAASES